MFGQKMLVKKDFVGLELCWVILSCPKTYLSKKNWVGLTPRANVPIFFWQKMFYDNEEEPKQF